MDHPDTPLNAAATPRMPTGETTQAVTAGIESPAFEKTTIVVHSGDFDKLYSAFIIGNGALAMGMEVSLYFTFWGLIASRRGGLDSGPLSQDAHAWSRQVDGQAAA